MEKLTSQEGRNALPHLLHHYGLPSQEVTEAFLERVKQSPLNGHTWQSREHQGMSRGSWSWMQKFAELFLIGSEAGSSESPSFRKEQATAFPGIWGTVVSLRSNPTLPTNKLAGHSMWCWQGHTGFLGQRQQQPEFQVHLSSPVLTPQEHGGDTGQYYSCSEVLVTVEEL